MARQIKFRIWNGRNNKMQSWEDLKNANLSIVNWKNECHPDNRGEFDVMQFSEQLDINGVEIYESDVVTILADNGTSFLAVVWFGSLEGFYLAPIGSIDPLKSRFFKVCQVVGNIYQDAHLLKGGKNG